MPELPDLQVFSHNLNKRVKGKQVKTLTIHRPKKVNVTEERLKKTLKTRIIQEVKREGKELIFNFDNDVILSLHLMLNGEMHLFEGQNEQKYGVLEMEFDDGTGLVLTDRRGFAKATLNPEPQQGVDALSEEITPDFLKDNLARKSTNIKNFLLDQTIIKGIGNAYADEILWKARIAPFSVSHKLPENKIRNLAYAIKSVLKDAEKQILTHHPDIIQGEIRDFLLIHHPDKKESPTGAPILSKKIGSRKTYYTEEQELFE